MSKAWTLFFAGTAITFSAIWMLAGLANAMLFMGITYTTASVLVGMSDILNKG